MFDKKQWLEKTREHKDLYLSRFPQGSGFAIDGPNDANKWVNAHPKILFLLKETYGGLNEEFICMDSYDYNKPDNKNGFYYNKTNRAISKIAAGIIDLKNGEKLSSSKNYTKNDLSKAYEMIATIELKKSTNTRGKTCRDTELRDSMLFSKDFLNWQIEYLNPDVIFCCGALIHKLAEQYIFSDQIKRFATIFYSDHPSKAGYKVDDTLNYISDHL